MRHDTASRRTRPYRAMLLATAALAALLAQGNTTQATDQDAYTFAAMNGGICGPAQPRHIIRTAQLAPARTEIGPYARDLPRGAAAPSAETRPPLYEGLGVLTWPTGSANPQAQAYFDQGYRFVWAFNHGEAARAFRAAQALDPSCAMCFWGEAWALGPNINYPMEPDANARALVALNEARRLAPPAGTLQAGLIDALSRRYSPDTNADRKTLDQAYAEAMLALQARYQQDPELAMVTADALMNTSPWDYWTDGGRTPKGHTAKTVALLEGVLAGNPDHPGAIHLYIHTVEASDRLERAVPYARRLGALMPAAGHVVHMPSHVWYRLGLWRDSLEANRRASAADEAFLSGGSASLVYGQGYYAHNVHFVLVSALMGGDGTVSVDAARKLAGIVTDRAQREVPWAQPIAGAPYVAHARFSDPQAILALPAPDGTKLVRAHWHYARGEALARLGRPQDALAEAMEIDALAKAEEVTQLTDFGVPGVEVLGIASRVVRARAALAQGDLAGAGALFAEAAAIQDGLPYMEPPFWYYPVHQSLGSVLLLQGKPQEAEAAFREALRRTPNNGWAAAGLVRAADARGDKAAAMEAQALLAKNWFGGEPPDPDRL